MLVIRVLSKVLRSFTDAGIYKPYLGPVGTSCISQPTLLVGSHGSIPKSIARSILVQLKEGTLPGEKFNRSYLSLHRHMWGGCVGINSAWHKGIELGAAPQVGVFDRPILGNEGMNISNLISCGAL